MVIDFHIHSKYSFDCFLEPSKIVAKARLCGLEGLAVTDHDTMAGVEEFRRLAPDLYIIAGQEVSTRDGDIMGLFLSEEIKLMTETKDVIAEIRRQGGLAVLAHPFKWPHLRRDPKFLRQFDAVESFNARNNIPVPYLENFLGARAQQKYGLRAVAGSDTHEGFELGRARTIFSFNKADACDAKIKEAILRGQVVLEGREVSLAKEIVSHFSRQARSFLKR
ncbi:MAG: PHP domain-containing protein [Candidatus Omnitrophota bacterium]